MSVLGLIAGSGPLPFEVAAAARARGMQVAIAAIENNTDTEIEGIADGPFSWFAAGQLGALIEFLKESGCKEVILAGAVSKRRVLRDPASLKPDARALALMGQLAERGDDAILRALAGEFESDGLEVIESTRYLDDRLTREELIAGPEPGVGPKADLEFGMRVVESLGPHDVGQAVLVKDGTVLAIEAVEGTDAMLRRGAAFGAGAVLAKAAKPGQDMRFDVPVIGPGTLELAIELQIAAIGLEAGRTLILERERTVSAADTAGISILGMKVASA